ncbi:MATE family efflux transporter [Petrocella atlantisensis]|uniref:MATE family efflux transporter n=1 Tax=Petrocella atlantisensis TaxID=2173034 RepID=A0A3P7PXD8_9FIRM|nr:MATE family efflux transporter [Petrocella atlantisensis]VDN48327.1 MATE family efflux transporter [Petrocella atlantisensis]
MKKNKMNLTQDPVTGLIIKMTFPMIFGMLGIVAFNMVDTYYVSKLGLIPMAAMTLTFPVVMVIGALAQGIGIGAAALISKAVGEQQHTKIIRYTTDSLTLGLILVFVFVIAGLLTIRPLFTLLGADLETMPYVVDYMTIWYGGVMFLIIPMIGNSAIRALGDTKTPALIMTVAALVNMLFDPIFIFGYGPIPALGIKGAAIATVISRAITLIVSLYVLIYRQKIVSFQKALFSDIVKSFKDLIYIGIPNALTRIITPLAIGVITGLVTTFGKEATAGFGIATRIEMFAMLIINALASIFVPLLGQNIGAKKDLRVMEVIKKSELFSILYGLFVMLILILFGRPLAQIFTDNSAVIETVRMYLLIIPIGYGLQGLFLIHTSILNVINKPLHSAMISLIRMFLLYVPLAIVLSGLMGLNGIWIALNASFVISVLISKYMVGKLMLAHQNH